MTNQSHTELAAQALKWKSRIQDRWFMLSYDTTMELGDLLEQLAAALESPERVPSNLHTFLNAAAGEGLVLDGVDAADLYIELFPKTYAGIVTKESST